MKYIFNESYINDNELVFWIYVSLLILIIILTVFFVKKELKNEHKWFAIYND